MLRGDIEALEPKPLPLTKRTSGSATQYLGDLSSGNTQSLATIP
jgi:hypothetical protein